jgi:hypothetical protein
MNNDRTAAVGWKEQCVVTEKPRGAPRVGAGEKLSEKTSDKEREARSEHYRRAAIMRRGRKQYRCFLTGSEEMFAGAKKMSRFS